MDSIFDNMTYTDAADIESSKIPGLQGPTRYDTDAAESEKRGAPENTACYDGFEIQKVLARMIPGDLTGDLHIVFTNLLTCTRGDEDYRYHGRAVICSNPSVISTTGIIEAPAKPREYYVELMASMAQGLGADSVNKKYAAKYLKYNDARLPDIVEGYAMQAVFYYMTGEAFCNTRDCRLYNAHWQTDLLHSQISGRLCKTHQEIIDGLEMT